LREEFTLSRNILELMWFNAVARVGYSIADFDWHTSIISFNLREEFTLSWNILELFWLNAVVSV
jgi:hypothetical protein